MALIKKNDDLYKNIVEKRQEEMVSSLSREQKKEYELFLKNRYVFKLKKTKNNYSYPEPGDVFRMITCDELSLYGIVMNNHLYEDSLTVFVFIPEMRINDIENGNISNSDVLLGPVQVFKHMWIKGLFVNVSKCVQSDAISDYGYYDIVRNCFMDDYRKEIKREPEFYDVSGIAGEVGFDSLVYEALILKGYKVPCIEALNNDVALTYKCEFCSDNVNRGQENNNIWELQIKEPLQPIERHVIEDLIQDKLDEEDIGSIIGGGTFQNSDGLVTSCNIEIELYDNQSLKILEGIIRNIGGIKGSILSNGSKKIMI